MGNLQLSCSLTIIGAFVIGLVAVIVAKYRKPKQFKQKGDCNIIIDGKLYNMDSYMKYHHPAGNMIIQQFHNIDCTEFFYKIHSNPLEISNLILPKYYVMDVNHHYIDNERKSQKLQMEFENIIKCAEYPCICAKTAIYSNQHKFTVIENDNDNKDYSKMAASFLKFMINQQIQWKQSENSKIFSSFIVCFPNIKHNNIYQFETFLFNVLQYLHDFEAKEKFLNCNKYGNMINRDNKLHPLSFNFFGRSFFVAGLSPNSQRKARRFKYPALVFNALKQFDLMDDEYDIIYKIICKREAKFDCFYNPMIDLISYFGEAIAFSGRQIIDKNGIWKCPLWWLSSQSNIQNDSIQKELQRLKKLKLVTNATSC